jgi:hypothetical protein
MVTCTVSLAVAFLVFSRVSSTLASLASGRYLESFPIFLLTINRFENA